MLAKNDYIISSEKKFFSNLIKKFETSDQRNIIFCSSFLKFDA